MPYKSTHPDRIADQILRAVALMMVITIHLTAGIHKSPFISSSPYQFLAVSINQLCRVAVPLFVALSGYGLTKKYSVSQFHWAEFFKSRVLKLLPLYIGWSFFFYVVLRIAPFWTPYTQDESLFQQLIWGLADYHLYFVPMIFQLYLLFPLLLKLKEKWPFPTFIVSLTVQLFFVWLYQANVESITHINWSNQLQSFFFGSWIFYFLLGMYLSNILAILEKIHIHKIFTLLLVAVASYILISNSIFNINRGYDPIDALRTTRFTVMLYSPIAIIVGVKLAMKIKKIPWLIEQLGIHSYNIFLGHTFFLRILFTFIWVK